MDDHTMNDTSGFYKKEVEDILYGVSEVMGPDFNLRRDEKDQYEYPVHGWYWFDSTEEAYAFFGVPIEPEMTL